MAKFVKFAIKWTLIGLGLFWLAELVLVALARTALSVLIGGLL